MRPEIQYQSARKLQNESRYEESIDAFGEISHYRNSADRITYSQYMIAQTLQSEGRYEEAIEAYKELHGYSDSAAQIEACENSIKTIRYNAAMALQAEGKYQEAIAMFTALKNFSDSRTQIRECRYRQARELQNEGRYEEAAAAFKDLSHYSDSETQLLECRYQLARIMQAEGRYEEAAAAYKELEDYSDSKAQETECRYQQAAVLNSSGLYSDAYAIYKTMKGYRDVSDIIRTDANLAALNQAAIAPFTKVGEYVTFGTYPQTKEGKDETPVEWLILDVQEGKALLISRYGLDAHQFNKTLTCASWEDSTIRSWLNNKLFYNVFSLEERAAVLTATVDNGPEQGNGKWGTGGGNTTEDKLFLLSWAEANKYFAAQDWEADDSDSNTASRVQPTGYAINNGAYTGSNANGWWWLRSLSDNGLDAARVHTVGFISYESVQDKKGSVRPAFWIDFVSSYF